MWALWLLKNYPEMLSRGSYNLRLKRFFLQGYLFRKQLIAEVLEIELLTDSEKVLIVGQLFTKTYEELHWMRPYHIIDKKDSFRDCAHKSELQIS